MIQKVMSAIKFMLMLFVIFLFNCQYQSIENLVPLSPGPTPSYWCTWGAQNFAVNEHSLANALALGDHATAANNLTEQNLFHDPGWATNYFQQARADLYIIFDVGWDVPTDTQFDQARWLLGRLELATDKFPGCTGAPTERLRQLNERCQQAGWKGAGLWLAAHAFGEGQDGKRLDDQALEAYFRERARWCHNAGIEYWKVDYGFRGGDLKFRQLLTQIAREEAPNLWVEHARGGGPLNDEECPWDTPNFYRRGSFRTWDDGRVLQRAVELVSFSQVFRTYDVSAHLSIPTTLDRVAQILAEFSGNPTAEGLLNCEDEPFIGAVLGCAIGVMRHPRWLEGVGKNYDPLQVKKRIDEVTRAVRWQRITPAFGVGATSITLDDKMLHDTWTFSEGETWATWLIGKEVMQAAPARVARGMNLPEVDCSGEPPYVIAAKHPNGASAVATLPRISSKKGFYFPAAAITVDIGSDTHLIGIFGRYRTLTLKLSTRRHLRRILAQDLAGDKASDITSRVVQKTNELTLSGDLIEKIGLAAATPGDISEPGLVLKLEFGD